MEVEMQKNILFNNYNHRVHIGVEMKNRELRVYALSTGAYTDKKENKIFLLYKEIQKGAVAKSYMTNGLLIYE